MKRFLWSSALCATSLTYAQFNIQGMLKNYPQQPVVIHTYENGLSKFLAKTQTNTQGAFTYKVPFDYKGLVEITIDKGSIDLLSDNQDIVFETDLQHPEKKIKFKSGINKELEAYNRYKTYLNIKERSILPLQTFYTPDQPFYQAMEQEKHRIERMKPVTPETPQLAYYLKAKEDLESYGEGKLTPEQIKNSAKRHLIKDDLNLESFGFLTQFVAQYLPNALQGAKSRAEAEKKLQSSIDELLADLGEETPRGQAVLLTILNLLGNTNFKHITEEYKQRVERFTCEVNPQLKTLLEAEKNIQPGKKVPNISFNEPVKGKKTLYEIKANKKLLIFWGSWCGHCQSEWPYIKAFYPQFKKEGGEIVAFAVDLAKANYEPYTKGTDWYNYSDLLKWDSPVVKQFGVTGTPTFILLDKDNKVLKIGSKISEFASK